MQVMQISGLDKKRMRIFLEDGRSFVLYRGEVRRYSLEEGAELSDGQYEEICSEILKKRARRRTMHLLEKMDRTEAQIREKLRQGFYPEEIIEDAVAYVKGYHYLDDSRYAENYVRNQREKKSRRKIQMELMEKDMSVYCQSKYVRDWAGFPVYKNTETKYYPCGEKMFPDMLAALEEAEHFIFMEYFIVEEGYMFGKILEILKRKANQGVDVRFIYDDFGCVTTLPAKYYRRMQEWGIQCVRFNPLYPVMSVIMNNRDHKKILVVDGKVGFTGGINLADEYVNQVKRFGYWKDTAIRLEGEAVWSFTLMFLEMWDYITKSQEADLEKFRPARYQTREFHTDGYVQPYTDSPLDHENVGENIYMNIINRARNYVYIFTPYLIPDDEILKALQNAAKSGVDVRIIMPGIPDKQIIYWISQSYYEPLLECGVRIYQFNPGFLHAKCFVCDDEVAVVGSVNLDYRSLYLHFECGVWMYCSRAVMQVKADVLNTLEQSEEINMEFCRKRPAAIRTLQSVLRLFAPLL